MKTLLKVTFAIFLSISIVLLFVLQLMQTSQLNNLKQEVSDLSDTVATLTGDDPIIDPTTTPNDTIEPTSNPSGTIKVKLYYKNYDADPEMINCSADTFVYRTIPKTTTPLTDTVRLLLENQLTDEEHDFGLSSPFEDPNYIARLENFKLESVDVNNGVANLTFSDPDYFSSGGSCRVGLMTSMIDLTVKQFGSVDQVTYSPYDVFQP
jgi:spore germination protein GerM